MRKRQFRSPNSAAQVKQIIPWCLFVLVMDCICLYQFGHRHHGICGFNNLLSGRVYSMVGEDLYTLPEVSILLPLFNKARYLKQAFESIISLNISRDRYQIIVVDDHSTDRSQQIIREYQRGMRNLMYYRNECNLGTHMTRIRCVMNTRTKYMVFLDPDDCFVGDGVVEALKIIKEQNLELVEFGCRETWRMRKRKFYTCWRNPNVTTATPEEYIELLFSGQIDTYLHRKVLLTSTYKKAIMKWPEHMRNARLIRCHDSLHIVSFAKEMTTPFYYTPVLGEERHAGLRDNSSGEHYQPMNVTKYHIRLMNYYLLQLFGRSFDEGIYPDEPTVNYNVCQGKRVEALPAS